MVHVGLGCVGADDQLFGNLRVGEAVRRQMQDFEFLPGEEAGGRRYLSFPDFTPGVDAEA